MNNYQSGRLASKTTLSKHNTAPRKLNLPAAAPIHFRFGSHQLFFNRMVFKSFNPEYATVYLQSSVRAAKPTETVILRRITTVNNGGKKQYFILMCMLFCLTAMTFSTGDRLTPTVGVRVYPTSIYLHF